MYRYADFYFMLLPLVAGLWKFGRLSGTFRLLFWLSVYGLATELVADLLTRAGENNHTVYSVFPLADSLFVFFVFYGLSRSSFIPQITTCIVFLIFLCCNTLLFQSESSMPIWNIMAASLFQVILALLYFRDLLEQPRDTRLVSEAGFWFSCALLVYQALTFFRWTVFEASIVSHHYNNLFYEFNRIAICAQSVVRALAIWIDSERNERRSNG